MQPGSTLGNALGSRGISPSVVHQVATSMRPVFDFRRARPGDAFELREGRGGELLSFEYRPDRETIYRLDREAGGGLVATRQTAPLEGRVRTLAGVIETSVFDAFIDQGESPALVHAFADLFAWDVDFSRQVQPGDEIRLIYRKFYDGAGFVRYGEILAAEYRTAERAYTALYFEDHEGRAGYFTPVGHSLRRAFLRAPLDYSRISSRYSKSRLHPILKIRRPHEGIDYAAPRGTPVWAVADGVVVFAARNGGFGRLVRLRHPNGFETYYGHLSRYGKGIRVGRQVRQKDVIGYVGSTGLSTGPHLDYRVKVSGRYVDPMKLEFPKGRPVSVEDRERFERVVDERLGQLRELQPPPPLEASL
ncbi:MAG: M23 family metallopeptidase [Proteobacteria bacterium]|nr:M23 family metallopeptidase [Pseudomonadota bacterium]